MSEVKVVDPESVASTAPVENRTPCPSQLKKTPQLEAELTHTRKRLQRAKIEPLIQFTVYAYNCTDQIHDGRRDVLHLDYVSQGSPELEKISGGLQSAITALEHLVAVLKARLQ